MIIESEGILINNKTLISVDNSTEIITLEDFITVPIYKEVDWESFVLRLNNSKYSLLNFNSFPPLKPGIIVIKDTTSDIFTDIRISSSNHKITLFDLEEIHLKTKTITGKLYDGILIMQNSGDWKTIQYLSYDDKFKVLCIYKFIGEKYCPVYYNKSLPSGNIKKIMIKNEEPRDYNSLITDTDVILCDGVSRKLFNMSMKFKTVQEIINKLDSVIFKTIDPRAMYKIFKLHNQLTFRK